MLSRYPHTSSESARCCRTSPIDHLPGASGLESCSLDTSLSSRLRIEGRVTEDHRRVLVAKKIEHRRHICVGRLGGRRRRIRENCHRNRLQNRNLLARSGAQILTRADALNGYRSMVYSRKQFRSWDRPDASEVPTVPAARENKSTAPRSWSGAQAVQTPALPTQALPVTSHRFHLRDRTRRCTLCPGCQTECKCCYQSPAPRQSRR